MKPRPRRFVWRRQVYDSALTMHGRYRTILYLVEYGITSYYTIVGSQYRPRVDSETSVALQGWATRQWSSNLPARMARCEGRLRSLADPHSSGFDGVHSAKDWIQPAIVAHRIVKWALFG